MQPKEVSDVDMAFGGKISKLMPSYEKIPDEFKRSSSKWGRIVAEWFFSGLPKGTEFIAKDGIDRAKALRHVKAILGSFEPKHEHKEAGCAYLLSLWFDDVKVPETDT